MAGKAEYKNQWQKENCDRVNLTLPKGRKAELQAHAAALGESVNGFIGRAISETMDRDSSHAAAGTPEGISLSSDVLGAAQAAAEATGEAPAAFVARAVQTQAERDRSSLKLGINPATGDTMKREA